MIISRISTRLQYFPDKFKKRKYGWSKFWSSILLGQHNEPLSNGSSLSFHTSFLSWSFLLQQVRPGPIKTKQKINQTRSSFGWWPQFTPSRSSEVKRTRIFRDLVLLWTRFIPAVICSLPFVLASDETRNNGTNDNPDCRDHYNRHNRHSYWLAVVSHRRSTIARHLGYFVECEFIHGEGRVRNWPISLSSPLLWVQGLISVQSSLKDRLLSLYNMAAKTECGIVLVVLCGLPGAGKTTLCYRLREYLSAKETKPFHVLHVCYDALIPFDIQEEITESPSGKYSPSSSDNPERTPDSCSWKGYRRLVLESVEDLVRKQTGNLCLKEDTSEHNRSIPGRFLSKFAQEIAEEGRACDCISRNTKRYTGLGSFGEELQSDVGCLLSCSRVSVWCGVECGIS